MSWQQYVDSMMATKNMNHVGIFGLDGSPWAATPNFPIDTASIKSIIANVGDQAKAAGSAVTISGERYILIRTVDNQIVYKKGPCGVIGFKSSQSIIIAIHDAACKAEQTSTAVGKISDYLSQHGY